MRLLEKECSMNRLSTHDDDEIRTWMYRNARPLEMARWRYHFEDGKRGDFLDALACYQNVDGGFGNAMEPDSWNPESTPYTTLKALELLEEIGVSEAENPLIRSILRYLSECPYTTANGWLFNIPSNDAHPHAPWWTWNPEANQYEHIGVTTGLCAFILKLADQSSPLYSKALSIATRMVSDFLTVDNFGEMGLGGFCQLLSAIHETDSASLIFKDNVPDAMATFESTLRTRLHASIEYDTPQWVHHVVRPSRYVRNPESPFLEELQEIVDIELDYLVRTRPSGDVWGIDWSWFGHNERYPKAFAISENWWKAWGAIDNLLLLRGFGRA